MTLTPIASSLIILAHSMVATYFGIEPASVPPIKGAYTVPTDQFTQVCGQNCQPPSSAIYNIAPQKIYIGVKPYYKERFIFSQLLHETVHHFQAQMTNSQTNDPKCTNFEEWKALSLQGVYLKSKGAKWFDSYLTEARKTFNNGKCN